MIAQYMLVAAGAAGLTLSLTVAIVAMAATFSTRRARRMSAVRVLQILLRATAFKKNE